MVWAYKRRYIVEATKSYLFFLPHNYIPPQFLKFYMYLWLVYGLWWRSVFFFWWRKPEYPEKTTDIVLVLNMHELFGTGRRVNNQLVNIKELTHLQVAFLLWTYWRENLNKHDIVLLREKMFKNKDARLFYQSTTVSAFIMTMIFNTSDITYIIIGLLHAWQCFSF